MTHSSFALARVLLAADNRPLVISTTVDGIPLVQALAMDGADAPMATMMLDADPSARAGGPSVHTTTVDGTPWAPALSLDDDAAPAGTLAASVLSANVAEPASLPPPAQFDLDTPPAPGARRSPSRALTLLPRLQHQPPLHRRIWWG